MKRYAQTIIQAVWLAAIIGLSCWVSSCNTSRQVEAYQKLESKMDAMVDHLGGQWVEDESFNQIGNE